MKTYPLTSSLIDHVIDLFDEGDGIQIQFKNGNLYHVPHATKEMLDEFLRAPSPGQFYNEIIKPVFQVVLVLKKKEWQTFGMALEDLKCGQRLEINPETGHVRALRLPPVQ